MSETGSTPRVLDGVRRTARILRALEASGAAPLAEIARAVSLSDATVLRYLNSLIAVGFVERDGRSLYRLGWELPGRAAPSTTVTTPKA